MKTLRLHIAIFRDLAKLPEPPMRFLPQFFYLFIGLLTACHAIAAPTTQPIVIDPAIEPFITAGTLMVAKIDSTRVDPAIILNSLIDVAKDASDPQHVRKAVERYNPDLPVAQKWLDDFHKAGGRDVYAVAFLGDPEDLPGVVIVPLPPGADGRAIAGLLVSGKADGPDHVDNALGGCEAIVIQNAVVYGLAIQAEKMKLARPVDRPQLAEALAALGDAPIKIAFSPSIALQIVAGEILPDQLPDFAGGGVPVALVHTLDWAAIGTSPPPAPGPYVHLVIQCKDPQGAQAYADVASSLLATLSTDPFWRKMLPTLDQFVAALKPSLENDRLRLDLDSRTLNSLVVPGLLMMAPAEAPTPATQP